MATIDPPGVPTDNLFLRVLQGFAWVVPNFFVHLEPPAWLMKLISVLFVLYAASVPITSYWHTGTILISDLSLFYIVGAVAFYTVGNLIQHSKISDGEEPE